jgi:cation diffusion facilitator CzcD-associated flavoprotein CzcO
MGNQFTPLMPEVEGIDRFKGDSWHSTHWDHSVDLQGKRIAVVGSAAAAVQIVPELAKVAKKLTVLQRTPNWIMQRNKKPYSAFQRKMFRTVPGLNTALIGFQSMLMNLVHDATTLGHKRMQQFEGVALKYLNSTIEDPALRELVTPKTRYGCKRPLVSDDFYPALNRANVELLATGLQEVTENGFITNDGKNVDVDVIVYCTGYQVQDFDRVAVIGEGDKNLAETLQQAPEAYKGMAVPDFPNFFFGIGPNGVCLTVTYFKTAELNAKAVVSLLMQKEQAGAQAISVKRDLHRDYNDWMLERFPKYSWGSPSCNSYYQTASGHVPFLYPDKYKLFKKEREQFSLSEFDIL